MQLIITDERMARSRTLRVGGVQLALALACVLALLGVLALALAHWAFQTGAREGWPLVRNLARVAVQDEAQERERYLRANIDAMARKLGEMQARVIQLEAVGERVRGLAGMPPIDLSRPPGQGGALLAQRPLSMAELDAAIDELTAITGRRVDNLTAAESRLLDQHIRKHMMPTQMPIAARALSSSFGVRIDPFSGRVAQHTGLDFPADIGTAIVAAAGGVVVAEEFHREYGSMVEIDHGNQIVTRYAHASKILVKQGDLVRRGQKIAEVGTTGRSTGPHLHFEVWVRGMYQDPRKFLFAAQDLAAPTADAGAASPTAQR